MFVLFTKLFRGALSSRPALARQFLPAVEGLSERIVPSVAASFSTQPVVTACQDFCDDVAPDASQNKSGAGKVVMQDFVCTIKVNKASV